jgi:hypothetical protein
VHLPILTSQTRELTSVQARSALPNAPVRQEAVTRVAPRRSPGVARRTTAYVLRRSADRLAPVIE